MQKTPLCGEKGGELDEKNNGNAAERSDGDVDGTDGQRGNPGLQRAGGRRQADPDQRGNPGGLPAG